jgi:hypothetical protein
MLVISFISYALPFSLEHASKCKVICVEIFPKHCKWRDTASKSRD